MNRNVREETEVRGELKLLSLVNKDRCDPFYLLPVKAKEGNVYLQLW